MPRTLGGWCRRWISVICATAGANCSPSATDGETGKVHAACYDLLASEARIAEFLAVANDHIPQESWFRLGRAHEVDTVMRH